jgi:hypothetical protein
MNPVHGPSGPQRQRRVSVRHRGAESDTATSSAADAAIREAIERRHRKRLDVAAASPGSAKAAPRNRPGGRTRPGSAPSAVPHAWTAVRVLVFVGVVGVLWQAVAGVTARRGSKPGSDSGACGFAGTVVFEGRPLAQAVLELHPLDGASSARALSVETDDRGGFARPASHGVAAGRYAVVVKSGCVMPRPGAEFGTPVVIPSRYTRPDSTPLQVAVSAAARLDLVVAR